MHGTVLKFLKFLMTAASLVQRHLTLHILGVLRLRQGPGAGILYCPTGEGGCIFAENLEDVFIASDNLPQPYKVFYLTQVIRAGTSEPIKADMSLSWCMSSCTLSRDQPAGGGSVGGAKAGAPQASRAQDAPARHLWSHANLAAGPRS